MQLRPYQERMIVQARQELRSKRSICLVLPTGGGKGQMLSYLSRASADKGLRTLVIAHRVEICEQLVSNATDWGVRFGRIMRGAPFAPTLAPVQIGMAQTAVRRLDRMPKFDLIVIDEAHHAVVGQWRKIADHFPDAKLVGLTATPQRLDGKGLGGLFESLVVGPAMSDLIADGFLAQYRYFVPQDRLDTSGLHMRGGDYKREEVEELVNKPKIVGNAVDLYERHFNGAPCITFCASINHAHIVEEAYRARGWRVGVVTGEDHPDDRARTMAAFRALRLNVLISVDVISEGVDVPGAQGVQLLRPTASLTLFLQQVGRALRPKPDGSKAIILDHVDNASRHGLPDADREWSLAGRDKKADPPGVSMCDICGRMAEPQNRVKVFRQCGERPCGFEPGENAGREDPDEVEGELEEVSELPFQKVDFRSFEEMIRGAATTQDAIALAKQRTTKDGKPYKPAWVYRIRNETPPWAGRRDNKRQIFS